jgi:hypothetical protein
MTKILLHKSKIFSLLLAFFLLSPLNFIYAQNTNCPDSNLSSQFQNVGGENIINNLPKYCSAEAFYVKFINYALFFIGISAILMLIYAGFIYMTAGASDANKKKGKDMIVWSLAGLVLVLMAAALVNLVINFIN